MRTTEKTLLSCLAADVLHLILVPSEGPRPGRAARYGPRRMRPEVFHGIQHLLTDRVDDLRALALSWAGGEPLEARDQVFALLEHARALRERRPALAFTSDLATGGELLDRPTFERLVDLGVGEFRVTFGGPTLRAGRERVWRNLTELRAVDRPFTVRVRIPAEGGERHLERYCEVLSGDARFDLTRCVGPAVPGGLGARAFIVRPDGRVERRSACARVMRWR